MLETFVLDYEDLGKQVPKLKPQGMSIRWKVFIWTSTMLYLWALEITRLSVIGLSKFYKWLENY